MEASAAALLHWLWPGGCADHFYRTARLCRPQARGAKRQSRKSVQGPRRHGVEGAETAQRLRQPFGRNTLGCGVASAGAVVSRSARQRQLLGGAQPGKRGQPQGKRAVSHRIAGSAGDNVVGRAPPARAGARARCTSRLACAPRSRACDQAGARRRVVRGQHGAAVARGQDARLARVRQVQHMRVTGPRTCTCSSPSSTARP
jgi:hypothetical protein